jgi:hypothetical protein
MPVLMPHTGFGFGFGSGSGYRFCSGSGSGSRNYLAQFVKNQKFVQNLAISLSEAALFPRKLASPDFLNPFYVGSGAKSGSAIGTVMHSGSAKCKKKLRFLPTG